MVPNLSSLSTLSSIVLFHLNNILRANSLSGNFPFRSLINTSNLTVLDLSYNNYDGTIAEDAFQNLGQLQWL